MPIRLTRRQAAATAVAPAILRSAGAQSAKRPNLVLLLSDDHSAEFTGCYGNPVIRTPNIDRFASEGMKLDRFFCAAPQCVPSRTAFLTGMSPVAANMGRFSAPLPARIRTLPEYLRQAGYFTGVVGRNFHLDGSPQGPVSGPVYRKLGLQTFRRRVDFLEVNDGVPRTLEKIGEFFERRPAGSPFFLWINYRDPHHPWDNNALTPGHDPAKLPIPKYLPDLPGVREDLRRYYDEIGRLDIDFKKTLDLLDNRAGSEETLVLLLGDNGCPFPHGKGSLYDPGLHVPALARWRGRIRPGSAAAALISGEDVTPTFLDAAGLAPGEGMSGRSFLPVLTGQAARIQEHVFAQRLTHGNRPFKEGTTTHTFDLSRAVRSERYKLIYNCTPQMTYSPVDSYTERSWLQLTDEHLWGRLDARFDRAYFGARPVLELYDVDQDPGEFNNLAGRPELAAIQRTLTIALQEKMIFDQDFLPLPLNE
jgi:N-sulfoglucosamine sulfohydrolase